MHLVSKSLWPKKQHLWMMLAMSSCLESGPWSDLERSDGNGLSVGSLMQETAIRLLDAAIRCSA
jgi:hypothetical protein